MTPSRHLSSESSFLSLSLVSVVGNELVLFYDWALFLVNFPPAAAP